MLGRVPPWRPSPPIARCVIRQPRETAKLTYRRSRPRRPVRKRVRDSSLDFGHPSRQCGRPTRAGRRLRAAGAGRSIDEPVSARQPDLPAEQPAERVRPHPYVCRVLRAAEAMSRQSQRRLRHHGPAAVAAYAKPARRAGARRGVAGRRGSLDRLARGRGHRRSRCDSGEPAAPSR